ncbi:unnamed protein product [Cyprideis torosa]|uniref:Uncharacterized protein n=1 Tax=Cyprideis torosa TaxID=163714 RepID=A0A7R8WVD3_9CRUS|nr:unnamed protein product [Cyprideis torosa]CAG0911151.1 unnamed protein product [Cyprideis torosa]
MQTRALLCVLVAATGFAGTANSASQTMEFTRGQAISLACSSCHGTEGVSYGSVPSLKGRPAEQIEEKMQLFKKMSDKVTIMSRIAKGYSEEEITMVADYFGSLK